MANYYISDLHIGHEKIIRMDGRPFYDGKEMFETIRNNWNGRITAADTVYILGDMLWVKEREWPSYISTLSGKKVLIRGNHDPRDFSAATKNLFLAIKDYDEIKDCGRRVVLCHYPIPFFHYGTEKGNYMLYGHVHNTAEYRYLEEMRKKIRENHQDYGTPNGNFINVGCMMPWMNYTPRTLNELIDADDRLNPIESGENGIEEWERFYESEC